MHSIFELLASVLRGVLKLTLFAFATVVIAGILAIGISVALLALLRAVLTGRKPAAWQTFMRFRHSSQRFRSGVWSGPSAQPDSKASDVVDVQAHEVRSALDDRR